MKLCYVYRLFFSTQGGLLIFDIFSINDLFKLISCAKNKADASKIFKNEVQILGL